SFAYPLRPDDGISYAVFRLKENPKSPGMATAFISRFTPIPRTTTSDPARGPQMPRCPALRDRDAHTSAPTNDTIPTTKGRHPAAVARPILQEVDGIGPQLATAMDPKRADTTATAERQALTTK